MLTIERWSAKVDQEENTKNIKRRLIPSIFGKGGLPDYPGFYELPVPEKNYYMLYKNGCRIPYKSRIANTDEWMLYRAGETNFAFSLILESAKKRNKKLYRQLSESQRRLPEEPMPKGVYELYTGPRNNKDFIYPMQGIYGYAGSRVFFEIAGRRGKRNEYMILNALKILDKVVEESETRSEFIARLANKGFHNGAHPVDMLSHIFPNGILTEQNCFTDYQAIYVDLKKHSPEVFKIYQSLSPKVLVMNDISPIGRFLRNKPLNI